MTSRVLALGDTSVDLLLRMPELPGPGGDAVATSQLQTLGGSATNTAVALRRLGLTVALVSRIGDDAGGDFARRTLIEIGVDIPAMTVDPVEPTSLNIVAITPDGERSMMAYRGANASLAPESLSDDLLADTDWLHLSGYALITQPQRAAAQRALAQARIRGIPTSLDVPVAGVERAAEHTLGLLPDLSLLMIGADDAIALTGQSDLPAAMGRLTSHCLAVAVKHGAAGAELYRRNLDVVGMSALAVTTRDTTGSGDAFAAGLVAGVLARLPDAAALLLANTLGAVVAQQDGASAPPLSTIVAALQQWPPTHARLATMVRSALTGSKLSPG